MATYRHSGSEAMFCRFPRVPSHHMGLADRFRRRTLLFTAFGYYSAYYTPVIGSLSTLLWEMSRLMNPTLHHVPGLNHRRLGVGHLPGDRLFFVLLFFFFHGHPSRRYFAPTPEEYAGHIKGHITTVNCSLRHQLTLCNAKCKMENAK